MKYIGEDEKVRTLIVERHTFKGVKNYFTNSLLYQDSLEPDENPHPEEPDSGNEADMEPEEDEYLWEINPLVMRLISSIAIPLPMLKTSGLSMKI